MFLFLSKLLPLFLYPIGLSSLLLAIAMIVFWKRPRIAAGLMGTALGVLLFSSNIWVAQFLVQGLELQYRPVDPLPKAAAIVVLGGSTRPPIPPRTWPEVNEGGDRVLYGARLYRAGKAPQVILSGGRIAWEGSNPPEAQDMKTMMIFMGVPEQALRLDSTSLNTYQNAVNVKQILTQAHIDGPILLVTSAIHMPRSMAIFKKQGIQAIAAPTDYLFDEESSTEGVLDFILQVVPDAEALFRTTIALKEYVGMWVYRLQGWA
ncbi:MAG: YdcF family protein [Thermosynechococcaceae cyanobacterium]